MYSLLPWCYLGCCVAEMTKAVRALSAVRGGRVCAHSSIVPCGERVSAPWCACLQDGALPAAVPLRGRAWNSVPHSVFVHSLFQSGKPCKQLGLHSFAPAVCRAALSVLVYRLCPAEVAHCLCRGTLGELEVTLMVASVFVTSVAFTSAVHMRADPVIRAAVY